MRIAYFLIISKDTTNSEVLTFFCATHPFDSLMKSIFIIKVKAQFQLESRKIRKVIFLFHVCRLPECYGTWTPGKKVLMKSI